MIGQFWQPGHAVSLIPDLSEPHIIFVISVMFFLSRKALLHEQKDLINSFL